MIMRDLVTAVNERLVALKFTRRKKTWNRQSGAIVHVIDIQKDNSGELVTLNVGVFCSNAYKVMWGKDAPAFAHEVDCIARSRVGDLINGKDLWWDLDAMDGANSIINTLDEFVLPFLEKFCSEKSILEYLDEGGMRFRKLAPYVLYGAILRYRAGDEVRGCNDLRQFMSDTRNGGWVHNAEEIAIRLGCR